MHVDVWTLIVGNPIWPEWSRKNFLTFFIRTATDSCSEYIYVNFNTYLSCRRKCIIHLFYAYQLARGCCRLNTQRWMYWTTGKLSCNLHDGATYLVHQRHKDNSELYIYWTCLVRTASDSRSECSVTPTITYTVQVDNSALYKCLILTR